MQEQLHFDEADAILISKQEKVDCTKRLVLRILCSFDASKSTKGASKLRRDLINSEIANLRDLLPLPSSTRQRLSQLQLMALVCVYVRKANYFHHGEYCTKDLMEHPFEQSFDRRSL